MTKDRIDAIAASEPLVKKLHEPTPSERPRKEEIIRHLRYAGLAIAATLNWDVTQDASGATTFTPSPDEHRHNLGTLPEPTPLVVSGHSFPVTIADSSTLAAALEYVKTWHDWLDTCVTREASDLPPAVLTRYQDALVVMEEAEKDCRCQDCEVAPITRAILNRELPRFVCDACFEKEQA